MRKIRNLIALVLMLALCMSMAVTANADEFSEHAPAYITKDLEVAAGTTMDEDMTFTFDFARDAGNSVGLQDKEVDTYPLPVSVSITIPKLETASTTNVHLLNEGQVVLPTDYEHAGVYAYTVTETATNPITGVGYSSARYTMLIGVVNSGEDDLVIKDIQVKSEGGGENSKVGTSSTAQPGQGGGGEDGSSGGTTTVTGNGFKFENTYIKTIGNSDSKALEITNKVAGAYADKTKPFSYVLTVTKNSLDKNASYNTNISGKTLTFDQYGVATIQFDLKHGESLTIDSMVAGATYKVEQVGTYEGYTKTVTGNETGVVGENGVKVDYLNTYKDVTPTGVELNNAPFMLMIGASALFLVLLFVSKKRREEA